MQNRKNGNSKSRRNNRVAKKTNPRRRPSGPTRRPSENQMEAGLGHHRPENGPVRAGSERAAPSLPPAFVSIALYLVGASFRARLIFCARPA